MHPTFSILYNNQSLQVKESIQGDKVLFTIEMSGETHIFSMGENGLWQSHPILNFEQTQEIGRLIEMATS